MLVVAVFFCLASTASAYESSSVLIKSFTTEQLDDDTLYEEALSGNLINNEHTQVEISTVDGVEFVTIKKLLNTSLQRCAVATETYAVTVIGTKEETADSGSSTVRIKGGFQYEKKTFELITAYKATTFYATPTILDSRFRLSSLNQTITTSGYGYTATGQRVFALNETNSQGPFTNPTSGVMKSKNTGFTNYVAVNDVSGLDTNITLKYQRIDTGTTYSYPISVSM